MVVLSGTAVIWPILLLYACCAQASDILKNNGFQLCMDNSDIKVTRLNFEFDRSSKSMTFDIAGSSSKTQNVTASMVINAYGQSFTQEFDPCDEETKLDDLCPGTCCSSPLPAASKRQYLS